MSNGTSGISTGALSLESLAQQAGQLAKRKEAARRRKAERAMRGEFPVGSVVVTAITGSDPRVWKPERAAARKNGLVGVVVAAFPKGYAVRAGADGNGEESYYLSNELRWHVPQCLYAVMLEKYDHKLKLWAPSGFLYCHGESSAHAKTQASLMVGERVAMVAPAIGATVQVDAQGQESLVL